HALEIVAFIDEEGAYLGMLGSRAMTGNITDEDIDRSRGRDGEPLVAAMARRGLDPAKVHRAARSAEEVAAYVELHIEQGPVLERAGCDIGVASSIVGLRTSQLCFCGEANHAGTTPMTLRRDALRAAAETVAATFGCVNTDSDPSLRLTYGAIDVEPGASNVVPSRALVTQEIRAATTESIDELFAEIVGLSKEIAERNGVAVEHEILQTDAPAPMSPRIMAAIEAAAYDLGLKQMALPSGAGHDAQYLARLCDAGLIFVPSRDGVSHNPRECTEPTQLVAGAAVLLKTLETLVTS
ncbi:MAG: Zn-dependent hydrolase, partial [Pseudomonadota bacterium]